MLRGKIADTQKECAFVRNFQGPRDSYEQDKDCGEDGGDWGVMDISAHVKHLVE